MVNGLLSRVDQYREVLFLNLAGSLKEGSFFSVLFSSFRNKWGFL
jgi:hypothetical protein